MRQIVKKSIEELNELLPNEKKLKIKDTTPLIGDKSSLESIDLVNLFVSLEKNLKSEKNLYLTFDELLKDLKNLKTINSLEIFLKNKFENEEK
tara:strand:- start:10303 stop:10581 length:279 start_codon:yes stop_codon:yes gene_type:complete